MGSPAGINVTGHPLVVTLANTRELLYLWNRPGNRPSHERAYIFFDRSIDLCRRAGFRKILMKGDTDFSQSLHLDRWHNDNVQFVFGFDAIPKLVEMAENLDKTAWKQLHRKQRTSREFVAPTPKNKWLSKTKTRTSGWRKNSSLSLLIRRANATRPVA
jgi:hypothetical protein